MASVRDSLGKARGVRSDDVLDEAIALADQFLPNRAFPDKGVDIIEQSIAHALANGEKTVSVTQMRAAVESLVGMPLDPTARLSALTRELRERSLLAPAATDALLERLGVSLRGLDSNYETPDAVCLLWNGAAGSADGLAEVVARTLFGRSTSVIDIDLAGMTEDQSISTLLGSAPGLIGSDRALPLHALRRTPWQVVLFRGIDRCAVSIRDTITQALEEGSFTDSMGRRLPLGAAVVLLTAPAVDRQELVEPVLSKPLINVCTVVSGEPGAVSDTGRAAWLRREVLDPLAGRFARQGYPVSFDKSFVAWVDANAPASDALGEFVDAKVAAPLAASLPNRRAALKATIVDGKPAFILPK